MRPERFVRILAQLSCAGVALLMVATAATAAIYAFIDERGVTHYTNVPVDTRYQPVTQMRRSSKKATSLSYESYIREAASRYEVDPLLVKAVIKVESDFDHRAVSRKGAMGLMQLMPETARDMRVHDPFNARANIMGGTRYLGQLLDRFEGDLRLALAAYNAGPQRVILARYTVPRLPETVNYVKKVLHHYQRYRAGARSSRLYLVDAAAY